MNKHLNYVLVAVVAVASFFLTANFDQQIRKIVHHDLPQSAEQVTHNPRERTTDVRLLSCMERSGLSERVSLQQILNEANGDYSYAVRLINLRPIDERGDLWGKLVEEISNDLTLDQTLYLAQSIRLSKWRDIPEPTDSVMKNALNLNPKAALEQLLHSPSLARLYLDRFLTLAAENTPSHFVEMINEPSLAHLPATQIWDLAFNLAKSHPELLAPAELIELLPPGIDRLDKIESLSYHLGMTRGLDGALTELKMIDTPLDRGSVMRGIVGGSIHFGQGEDFWRGLGNLTTYQSQKDYIDGWADKQSGNPEKAILDILKSPDAHLRYLGLEALILRVPPQEMAAVSARLIEEGAAPAELRSLLRND